MKELGLEKVVKKKKKYIEECYDDCGENLSSLGGESDADDEGAGDDLVHLMLMVRNHTRSTTLAYPHRPP